MPIRKATLALLKNVGALSLALVMSSAIAEEKPTLRLGYVNGWDDGVAATHVVAEILKSKLGYSVELMPVEPAIMWQGVARGDLDATLAAWLPATHGEYYEKTKDRVVVLGTNFEGAKIGLVVPDYVQAKSIEDLNNFVGEFKGTVTGIDAGAGVMRRTEEVIKKYDLNYKLMPSSGPAMAVALTRAEKAKEPIVVTSWIPHWMFAKWKLRFLDDPKNIYGAAEHVDTVVNPSLLVKAADASAFLKKFSWNAEEVGAVMLAISEGSKPDVAARDWIAKNPERVAGWLN